MVSFAGGKFCENVGKSFHVEGNFHDYVVECHLKVNVILLF